MEPNYFTNETLLVNQVDKNFRRGQVVAAYENQDVAKDADYFTRFRATFLLKRVIGLPGEDIELLGSKVIIYNSQYPEGVILSEDYISSDVKFSEDKNNYYYPRTKIPDKKYFLMGDNRTNSSDSRVAKYGPFADYAIFGQESFRFWPLARFDTFDLPKYTYTPLTTEQKAKLAEAEIKYKNPIR
jgi:signal peptidase I